MLALWALLANSASIGAYAPLRRPGKKHTKPFSAKNAQFSTYSDPTWHLRKRRLSSGAKSKPLKPLHFTSERRFV